MADDLESFYTIDQWALIERKLVVRFIPDFLATELVDPVITATIFEPNSIEAAEVGLPSWQAEMIIAIQAREGILEVSGEFDSTPFAIHGREVQLE